MLYVGVDNGLQGAIAVLQVVRGVLKMATVYDMPVVPEKTKNKKRFRYDDVGIANLFKGMDSILGAAEGIKVMLEKAQCMPKQGRVGVFNYGDNYGFIRGVLTSLSIPYELVPPKKWQKEYYASSGDPKGKSYRVASKLFPTVRLKTVRNRILDGRCDALLIAEYGRRQGGE